MSTGSIIASPNAVAFGSVPIGQTVSTTVSLTNGGSAPVQIAQLNLSGQPFSIVGPSSLPVTVAVGATYSLNVQFNPAAAGTATGQLTIATNSSTMGAPVITLSGTGATGTGSAALSGLYCSSGSMAGSGTDACAVTLAAPAPGDGLIVNLSSSGSAVAVPGSVVVPAHATSVGFTASVSSVASSQAVVITASADNVMKKFTLQLNAALLALSINATNVAFGDVFVNTPATQSVILTSTGTVPVTINGATLTGAGFTLSGPSFPVTLDPGQAATLSVEFDPTTVGMLTGQITITSNSSTNDTSVIGLSGKGTAVPLVAIAVIPPSVSTNPRGTQQFAASVTGMSNTAVSWTASGAGCSGATCGTISSSGLYTAPGTLPSPSTVTITATSVSDPTKSAAATVTIVPNAVATYYLAPAADGGNDSNNGLSPSKPWLSPNHSVNCGDVIIAEASSAYNGWNFEFNWGTVTCPNENNVAWLKCATFDGCKVIENNTGAFAVDNSFWGVEGWEVDASTGSQDIGCFTATPNYATPVEIHHIVFANNIANGCQGGGFGSFNQSASAGVDYLAIVGNIAYNAVQGNKNCYSGISVYQPIQSDSLPGTHIYVAGNFSWGNFEPSTCSDGNPSDGEGIIFDTFDGSQGGLSFPYRAQVVADNNILVANGGRGLQAGINSIGTAPFATIYFRHNTIWGNNGDAHQNATYCGEMMIYEAFNVQAFSNLAATDATKGCGANPVYAYFVGASATITDSVYQNWGYAASGTNVGIDDSTGFSVGLNNILGTDPGFANAIAPGAPSCGNYSSVPACMATVISNFTPTNPAAIGYGYQIPKGTPDYDNLFPQWLCNVNLPGDLVTMGCLAEP